MEMEFKRQQDKIIAEEKARARMEVYEENQRMEEMKRMEWEMKQAIAQQKKEESEQQAAEERKRKAQELKEKEEQRQQVLFYFNFFLF